ncbi:MAG: bi-domain-containing oxidoreductase [Rhodocyclaceae bacterium]|nr:bi-domain-containing oxidoreductase [Rhodocyclaceae bacterium]MBX3667274.1 bi-domain-containing oxidoreductase [Rhodocyclaceae bacterium]
MKQVLQNLNTGAVELADIPCPQVLPGRLLIRTRASLISSGTERMLIDFGRANLFEKARQQPDKVRMVIDKIRSDGFVATLNAVRNKLDQPLALGYSNSGVVVAVGQGVQGFAPGDRVVSNGNHAEIVSVPAQLCCKVPHGICDEHAAFAVVGAIALQGVRLLEPTLGEQMVVIGLGLIGLMTVQLLRAHGCRVLGVDTDAARLALARTFGAVTADAGDEAQVLAAAESFSHARGVDGVIVAASTASQGPLRQAARMCRMRGRIVLVGVAGLQLARAEFYAKELRFQVSCSYGPGRYDPAYEVGGHDYPYGLVRWTARRNFEAVLDLLAEQRIDVSALISHRYRLDEYRLAYAHLQSGTAALGIVLTYSAPEAVSVEALARRDCALPGPNTGCSGPVLGVIGAGNFAGQVLVPAFRQTGARLKTIVSAGGVSAAHVGRKNGFESAGTDVDALLADWEINAVVIATRHDCHAAQVCAALRAGKHVFVEKPLALDRAQLAAVRTAYEQACASNPRILSVGFNRRFAPQVRQMKGLLNSVAEPKNFIVTVNAGAVPAGHWTRDPQTGGGRIIGEACHFIDLLRHLAGHPVQGVQISGAAARDIACFTLRFADGSLGTVHYLGNGHRGFPKERIEVFCAGRVLQLDNFRRLVGWGWPGFRNMRLWRQDKGHTACIQAFVEAVRDGTHAPVPFDELFEITQISFDLAESSPP